MLHHSDSNIAIQASVYFIASRLIAIFLFKIISQRLVPSRMFWQGQPFADQARICHASQPPIRVERRARFVPRIQILSRTRGAIIRCSTLLLHIVPHLQSNSSTNICNCRSRRHFSSHLLPSAFIFSPSHRPFRAKSRIRVVAPLSAFFRAGNSFASCSQTLILATLPTIFSGLEAGCPSRVSNLGPIFCYIPRAAPQFRMPGRMP